MANDPYAARRFLTTVGPFIFWALALLAAGIVAYAWVRPTPVAVDAKTSAAMIAEMDSAQRQTNERRAVAEATSLKLL